MDKLSCDKRKDPVSRMIRDLTPAEVVGWLVEYHGLPVNASSTVEMNLREQFKYHRLQGRLDRKSNIAILAELWNLRQSVKVLERAPVAANTIGEDFEHFCACHSIPNDHLGIELIFKAFEANWRPTLK